MGLILRSIGGAVSSAFRDGISCEDMGQDILMMHKSTHNKVISQGSRYSVSPGQAAVFCNNGMVFDVKTEPGVYEVFESTTPSLFDSRITEVFKEIGERFTFGGATAKLQGVYYFNTREILNNGYGTPAPVPYKDWDHAIPNARTGQFMYMSLNIKCFGKYTFKISDPLLFMKEYAGSAEILTKDDLTEQLRSEIISVFSNVLNGLGDKQIGAMSLPSQTDEIKTILEERQYDESLKKRGLSLTGFVVESVTLDEESRKKIDMYETGGDSFQQRGMLTQAALDAANNSAGATHGMMGLGMFGNMFGGNLGQAPMQQPAMQQQYQQPPMQQQYQQAPMQQPQNQPAPTQQGQKCSNCGSIVSGKFCSECGSQVSTTKKCYKCGNEVKANAKFCAECGSAV